MECIAGPRQPCLVTELKMCRTSMDESHMPVPDVAWYVRTAFAWVELPQNCNVSRMYAYCSTVMSTRS